MNTEKIKLNNGVELDESTTLLLHNARPVRMNPGTIEQLKKKLRIPVEPVIQNTNVEAPPIATTIPLEVAKPVETIMPTEPTFQSQGAPININKLPNGIESLNPDALEAQTSTPVVDIAAPEMPAIGIQTITDTAAPEMEANNQPYDFNQGLSSEQINPINVIPAINDADQSLNSPEKEIMKNSTENDNKEEKEKPTIDKMIKDMVEKETEEEIKAVKVEIESLLQKMNMLEEKINQNLAEIDRAVKAANGRVEQTIQQGSSQAQTTEQADVPYQRVA
jgi:hypothetical protein